MPGPPTGAWMYLWRRPSGFTFQQRVPVNLREKFGESPIRLNLGPLPVEEAKRRARILAGATTALMEEPDMTREILTSSLAKLSAELNDIKREAAVLSPKLARLRARCPFCAPG
ncbi:DUF6538 domain-containing protein [Rhizobium ruizarguesonis]|uniref:DUF6538 domain-containing protein n=1 Tax=Rhizobium ruizarguesonis TaxID=2081791 RepID=UPI0038578B29